jgi:putative ABC transport system substrate-binding protein
MIYPASAMLIASLARRPRFCFGIALTGVLTILAIGPPAVQFGEAQPERKIARIGVLMVGDPPAAKTYIQGFEHGLGDLGYRKGENFTVEYRYAEGTIDEFRSVAAEFVRAKFDVIVTWGTAATAGAKQATTAIPIVAVAIGDPVGTGLIASLTRPGGNITGLSNMSAELSVKQLALLKELLPSVTHVAVLRNPTNPVSGPQLKWTALAARPLQMQLHVIEVRVPDELDSAFAAATKQKVGAMTVLAGPMFLGHRARIADLAIKSRLPTTFNWRQYAEAGGLLAYGPSVEEMWRRAPTFVDKVLRGTKPADLPFEQPTKFELVINMKTAQTLGLTMPSSLLLQADRVLE